MKRTKTTKALQLFIFIAALFAGTQLFATQGSNFYWVGGSGNWNDSVTHWAAASGAQVFHVQVPGPQDTVIFNSLSFSSRDTVWCDSVMLTCHSMKWLNVQYHPVFMTRFSSSANIMKIYGSLFADTNMTWAYNGKVIFRAFSGSNTIRASAHYFPYLSFDGNNGTWNLADTLRCGRFYFHKGNFYTTGKPVYTSEFRFFNNDTTGIFLDTSFKIGRAHV